MTLNSRKEQKPSGPTPLELEMDRVKASMTERERSRADLILFYARRARQLKNRR